MKGCTFAILLICLCATIHSSNKNAEFRRIPIDSLRDTVSHKPYDYKNEEGFFRYDSIYDNDVIENEMSIYGEPMFINCSLEELNCEHREWTTTINEDKTITIPATTYDDSIRFIYDDNYERLLKAGYHYIEDTVKSHWEKQNYYLGDKIANSKYGPIRITRLHGRIISAKTILYTQKKHGKTISYKGTGAEQRYHIANVEMSDYVRVIDGAFKGCDAKKIKLGGGVREITEGSFRGNTRLENIIVNETNKHFCSTENVLFTIPANNTTMNLVCYPRLKKNVNDSNVETRYTIPEKTYRICDYAFSGSVLESLEISESVKEIGWNAFENMEYLSQVKVHWKNPEEIIIDNQKEEDTHIVDNIFSGRYEIKIKGDRYYKKDRYYDDKMRFYYRVPKTPFHFEEGESKEKHKKRTLLVPKGCKEKYKKIAPWSSFRIKEFDI